MLTKWWTVEKRFNGFLKIEQMKLGENPPFQIYEELPDVVSFMDTEGESQHRVPTMMFCLESTNAMEKKAKYRYAVMLFLPKGGPDA